MDPYRFTKEEICRAVSLFGETLLENEEVQIRGLVYFCDGAGVSMPYLTLCTPREAVRLVKNGEVRTMKRDHNVNIGNSSRRFKYELEAHGFGL